MKMKFPDLSVVAGSELSSPLYFALAYAKLGWPVLPVWSVDAVGRCRCGRPDDEIGHSVGKHPQSRLAPHGHHDATLDEDLIREWWATDPDAGVGISLQAAGLIALDIDPRNGGRETLEKLETEHGPIYSDCTAKTQGGGEHRLFMADKNLTFPASLGKGLDLKHRGYICVAPTLGPFGTYTWADGRSPLSRSRPATPSSMPDIIAQTGRVLRDLTFDEESGALVATAQTFDDLRAALKYVNADDYALWVNVGMALKPYGENGYRVWTEWASMSSKFDSTAQRRKWDHDLSAPHSITYRSIFRWAIDGGWKNNVAKPLTVVPSSAHPMSMELAVGSGADTVTSFEYLYDGFMSIGVNVVAGAPGVGKTTLIMPLALVAAHLCPEDYPLKPSVRRNVIIITESVVQVQHIIYSLHNWGATGHPAETFENRVKVIGATRLDPNVVGEVASEYRSWTVDNIKADGSVFKALPLVLFDTANAVFDLENENDNAEVGRTLALTKQHFSAFPVIIVAHAAKAHGMIETDHLSPRGASAWSGDAQGVYTVFKDGDDADSPRVLKAVKVRFPLRFPEMGFDLVSNSQHHNNVLGHPVETWFTHAVARAINAGERTRLREERAELAQDKKLNLLNLGIIAVVRSNPGHARTHYEQLSPQDGGVPGPREHKQRAIDFLIEDGALKVVMLDKPVGRKTHYLEVNESLEADSSKGKYEL